MFHLQFAVDFSTGYSGFYLNVTKIALFLLKAPSDRKYCKRSSPYWPNPLAATTSVWSVSMYQTPASRFGTGEAGDASSPHPGAPHCLHCSLLSAWGAIQAALVLCKPLFPQHSYSLISFPKYPHWYISTKTEKTEPQEFWKPKRL